jgi:hypothetical protein
MLDARSLEHLEGEERQRAEFLCELCWTPAIEAIWSWGATPIKHGIRQAELRPITGEHRRVGRVGEPPDGFIGTIPHWNQFAEEADRAGLTGSDRDWFIYYGALAHFSDQHGWHFLVTSDSRLLKESEEKTGWLRRGRHRIASVGWALVLAGHAMKAHREVIYESPQPGHTIYTSGNSMYDYLARDLISSRPRIFKAMKKRGEPADEFHRSKREALCVSVFDRAADLLRACDRIALVNLRYDETGAVNEILYELRAAIANATGLFEAVAALARIAFAVDLEKDFEVSLNRNSFRKALKQVGASNLAAAAEQQGPLFTFLWSLRNPILHEGGLAGYTLHTLGVGQSYKATLSPEQERKLKDLCGHRHESPDRWGLDPPIGLNPSVDPAAFSYRLSVTTIDRVNHLLDALADDRNVPDLETTWTTEEREKIQRFRWLTGLPRA